MKTRAMLCAIAALSFSSAAVAQEVPGCRDAWNALQSAKSLDDAKRLVKKDCPVMYRNGWLKDTKNRGNAPVDNDCKESFNTLSKNKVLEHAKTLVTKDCPVMYRAGWKKKS